MNARRVAGMVYSQPWSMAMRKIFFCVILAIGAGLGYLPSVVGAWGWGAGLVTT